VIYLDVPPAISYLGTRESSARRSAASVASRAVQFTTTDYATIFAIDAVEQRRGHFHRHRPRVGVKMLLQASKLT